jgi:hypothetical protein
MIYDLLDTRRMALSFAALDRIDDFLVHYTWSFGRVLRMLLLTVQQNSCGRNGSSEANDDA